MKREEGYYWVLIGEEWDVARYWNGEWTLSGREWNIPEEDFLEIDDCRIKNPIE